MLSHTAQPCMLPCSGIPSFLKHVPVLGDVLRNISVRAVKRLVEVQTRAPMQRCLTSTTAEGARAAVLLSVFRLQCFPQRPHACTQSMAARPCACRECMVKGVARPWRK